MCCIHSLVLFCSKINMPLMLLLLFINKYRLLHDSTINTLCFDFVVYATSTVYGSINLIFFFSFSSSPSSRSKTLITRSEIDKAHLADTKQMIVTEVTETENPAFQAELEEGISFP